MPIGRFGSFKPERARITASATAVTASSWPMTRWCSSSSRCSSFCISPSSSLRHRDAGPAADHLGDVLLVHLLLDQARARLPLRDAAPSPPATAARAPASLPYFSSAARFRSYCRSACSISILVCSICSRSLREPLHGLLLGLPARGERVGLGLEVGQLLLELLQPLPRRRRPSPSAAPRARSRAA